MGFPLPLLFIFLSTLISIINPHILSIDLGSEFFKAVLVSPGQPFRIVENFQSKMKTPSVVAIKDDEIIFGADALSKKAKSPKSVFTFFKNYLGSSPNSTQLTQFMDEFCVSYSIKENKERSSLEFEITFNHKSHKLSIEEIYALLFNHIKYMSEKYAKIIINECFVIIPNFFTYKQRESISQAVALSKMQLIGLVSEPLAAAVHFQFKKDFDKEEYYIFYDMGGLYTQATLVSFKPMSIIVNNKTTVVGNEITIYGDSWDKQLGGQWFSKRIVDILMRKFDSLDKRQGKESVKGNKKIYERLLPNAIKYKEVLSANKEAHVSILGVDSYINLECNITREEFEEEAKDLIDKAYNPIEELIDKTGIHLDEITHIQLIGGSIRIPAVKKKIEDKLGKFANILSIHMNGDDSMAFGAAYLSVNSTQNVKGKIKAFMQNGANAQYKIYISNLNHSNESIYCNDTETLSSKCKHNINISKVLFPIHYGYGRKTSSKKFIDSDMLIRITETMENENNENDILLYEVKGIEKLSNELIKKNYTSLPLVKFEFHYNKSGIIIIDGNIEYNETLYWQNYTGIDNKERFNYRKKFTKPLSKEEIEDIDIILNTSKVIDKNSNETKDNSTKTITKEDKETLLNKKKIGDIKINTISKKLDITTISTYPKPLSDKQITEGKKKLDYFAKIEADRQKIIEIKNEIETFLYRQKENLEAEWFKEYAKDEELEISKEFLKNKTIWYDEEGYMESLEILIKEARELNEHFMPYNQRYKIDFERRKMIELFQQKVKEISEGLNVMLYQRPWVKYHYDIKYKNNLTEIFQWLNESIFIQSNLTKIEEPYLTAEMIKPKIDEMVNIYNSLLKIKEPNISRDFTRADWQLFGGKRLFENRQNYTLSKDDFEKMRSALVKNNTDIEGDGNADIKEKEKTSDL